MCKVCKGPTIVYRTYGRKVVIRERRCTTCHEQWETHEREDASSRACYGDAICSTGVAHRQQVGATSVSDLQSDLPDLGADQTHARKSTIVAKFPILGGKEWGLEDWRDTEWKVAFPGVNVANEYAKATAWLNANPTKKKTPRGMPAFLFRWLERNQNRGTAPVNGTARKIVPYAVAAEDSRKDSQLESMAEALLDD
jgi:hypothetical protein